MSISLAFTGASGLQYGFRLLECLLKAHETVQLVLTSAAYVVADQEMGIKLPGNPEKLRDYFSAQFNTSAALLKVYHHQDWSSPIASGTTQTRAMVICPCTSGTLASIANGLSDNLVERAADVMLKEQRKLICVHRETPLSVIQLENCLKLARAGALIMPANPGFYHRPDSVEHIIDFIVARILDHLEISHQLMSRWGE